MLKESLKPEERAIFTTIQIFSAEGNSGAEIEALWDTGASNTTISRIVAEHVGIKPEKEMPIYNANTLRTAHIGYCDIVLGDGTTFAHHPVYIDDLARIHCVIGMDIILKGDTSLTHSGDQVVFQWNKQK